MEHDVVMLGARRALYELLARLFLAPPDAALLTELAGLPGFAEALPSSQSGPPPLPTPHSPLPNPRPPTPDPRPPTPDSQPPNPLAVEYEYLFGRNVYPYESLYADRDLMLNTAAAEAVVRLYDECGFVPSAATGAPDHLGLELGLMAHLLASEIAARDSADPAAVAWSRAQQARCLHSHLARWAPLCLRAVERAAPHPFYLAVAQLTLELMLGDLRHLSPPGSSLPTPPSPLPTADDSGLNGVVRTLLTPDLVGIFLSRADLSGLGRRLGLPAPMGERFQMLRGLFESAGQFELLPPLIAELDGVLAAEAGALAGLAGDYPAWAGAAESWLGRVAQGRALLGELREQAGAEAGEPGL